VVLTSWDRDLSTASETHPLYREVVLML
jgi:hypothetical protein